MSGTRTVGLVDTMWLQMDRPSNLMVIETVMWSAEPIDWQRFKAVLARRVVDRYPVFRQRAIAPLTPVGLPYYVDDPDFTLDRHLVHARLDPPGDEAALQRYVERQMHVPLDRSRPLWQVHLVEGYGTGSAVVSRFHHSLADGIALTRVLLDLTDRTPDADLLEADQPAVDAASNRHRQARGVPLVSRLLSGGAQLAEALPYLASPARARDLVGLAGQAAQVSAKLLLGANPPNPLAGTPGIRKRAVWSDSWSLTDVRRAGRCVDASINDVLMTALAGALHAYLAERAEPVDLTTMVPVNLRPPHRPLPPELGNMFALLLLPLPIALADPCRRLEESKRRMDAIKRSPEPVLTYTLINAIGSSAPPVAQRLIDFFAAKAIGVTTNVPGPREPRYLAGAPVEGLLGWVPGSGRQTLGACVISYDGRVRVGFKADERVVDAPESLVAAFDEELRALIRRGRRAPVRLVPRAV